MSEKSTKMSAFSCITMAVGAIIGAGLFSALPLGITMVGHKVGWAFIAAAIFVCLKTLPSLYLQSSLPVSGSSYMYLARLVHPSVGYVQSLNSIIGTLNIAVMSMTFANYFSQLFPNAELNATVIAVVCALFFSVIGTFGAKFTGTLQNIIVALLVSALGIYIVKGMPAVDHAANIADFIAPTADFFGIWGAVAILNYTLQGGAIVGSFADEVENPGRTIPLSFFGATIIVTLIYIVIGYITVSVGPIGDANGGYNLGAIAGTFMSANLVRYFIVAGALFGTITTLNGSLMIYSRLHFVGAKDGIWPKVLTKTNKYNVPYISLWASSIFAIGMMLTGINLSDVLKIVSVPGLLLGIVFYIPPIIFEKRYPNAAARASIKLSRPVNIALCIFSVVMSIYMGFSLLKSLTASKVISMAIFYCAGYVYYFVRWKYMKDKHGIDIIQNAKGSVPQWDLRNAPLTKEEAAK